MDRISATLHQLIEVLGHKLGGENGIAMLLLWATVILAGLITYAHASRGAWSLRGFAGHLLPPTIFRHASARADFLFWLSRRLFMPFFVLPLTISTVAAGHFAHWALLSVLGPPASPPGPAGPLLLVLFTATMLLAYDLSYYTYHRLQHQVPLLWELHKVHHSAQVLIGVTKDRVHPVDELMNHWWDGLIPGLCYGIWLFFALDPVEVTLFGLNVYMLRNTVLMMDFVRHTHLKLSYGQLLSAVLISPHYHQLHHSIAPKHLDRNFGLTFTVWDWMFGTLVVPEPNEDFEFGLTSNEHDEYQSLFRLHILPIQKIGRRLYQAFVRRPELQADRHAGETS
ncbi:MAG: sterol desaturase family protein [Alphaproteobacteria bacterium]|nr:sterol desaturase family protein [Alphaproteobacteria bacterium]